MYYVEGPYKPIKQVNPIKAIIQAEVYELLTWAIVGTIAGVCVYTILYVASAIGSGL